MEPEQTSEEIVVKKQANVWNSVTPLSKYLAMTLFVALPFIGGWVGYTFAPEKVIEVERIIGVEKLAEQKQEAEQPQERSEVSVSDYRISNFNTTYGGSRYGEVAISADGTKKYLMQLPYTESVCCEYLHYSQEASPDNGFNKVEELLSLEEAGLLYQRKWPVSDDNNYIAVSTFDKNALLLCDQVIGLDNKKANNVLNIVDTNTSNVTNIFTHEYEATDFSVLEFSDDGAEIIVEQTMYPIDEDNGCANNSLPGDTRTVSYPVNI